METELLGIELPMDTWKELFLLAEKADRAPSDYLRVLISRELERCGLLAHPIKPEPCAEVANEHTA